MSQTGYLDFGSSQHLRSFVVLSTLYVGVAARPVELRLISAVFEPVMTLCMASAARGSRGCKVRGNDNGRQTG